MNRFIRNAPFWARTTTFIIVLIVVTGSLAVVLPRINFDDDDVLPSASAAPSASSDSLSPSPSVLPTVTLSPDPTSPLPEPTVVSSPPPPQYTWQYLAYKPPVRNDGLSLADSSKLKNGQEFKHALWAGKGDWSIHSRSATYVLASRCTKFKATVGVDINSPDPGTARFTISDDTSVLKVVSASNTHNETIEVDIRSVDRLTLRAERTTKGYPTFTMVFGDPQVYCPKETP